MDLSKNSLWTKTGAELTEALAPLPAGIKVSLKNNKLFTYRKHTTRDKLLTQLRLATPHITLDLSENGESDMQRAIAPLVGLFTLGRTGSQVNLPKEIFVNIISFLMPIRMPSIERIFLQYVDNHATYMAQEIERSENKMNSLCNIM